MNGSDALLREWLEGVDAVAAGPAHRMRLFQGWLHDHASELVAALDATPEPHVHKVEYPSSCTGCEHLAAAFVAAAPDWMLVGRATLDATNDRPDDGPSTEADDAEDWGEGRLTAIDAALDATNEPEPLNVPHDGSVTAESFIAALERIYIERDFFGGNDKRAHAAAVTDSMDFVKLVSAPVDREDTLSVNGLTFDRDAWKP